MGILRRMLYVNWSILRIVDRSYAAVGSYRSVGVTVKCGWCKRTRAHMLGVKMHPVLCFASSPWILSKNI